MTIPDPQTRLLLEGLQVIVYRLEEIVDLLRGATWTCGCGTVNSVGLSQCGLCGRQRGAQQ